MHKVKQPVNFFHKRTGIPANPQGKSTAVIPKGMDCGNCPYFSVNRNKPLHQCGYCSLLCHGDWMNPGFSLLWDGIKSCRFNDYWGDDDVKPKTNFFRMRMKRVASYKGCPTHFPSREISLRGLYYRPPRAAGWKLDEFVRSGPFLLGYPRTRQAL